jgi:hypothetical protein
MINKVIAKYAERQEGPAEIAGVQDGSELRNDFAPVLTAAEPPEKTPGQSYL